jgi:hypothetical protein
MANDVQQLENRISQLEAQLGGGQSGQAQQGGGGAGGGGSTDPALVQAFLQGALVANALSQAASGAQQGVSGGGGGGQAPAFLSIFGCGGGGGGGGGFNPTHYDSFFWCRSRFMCNPQSLSCLC